MGNDVDSTASALASKAGEKFGNLTLASLDRRRLAPCQCASVMSSTSRAQGALPQCFFRASRINS